MSYSHGMPLNDSIYICKTCLAGLLEDYISQFMSLDFVIGLSGIRVYSTDLFESYHGVTKTEHLILFRPIAVFIDSFFREKTERGRRRRGRNFGHLKRQQVCGRIRAD